MKSFIAHDLGTSGVKSIIIDESGNILAHAIEHYPLRRPRPGWVEQKPEDYWDAVCRSTRKIVQESGIHTDRIGGIVFTTQAMGIIPVSQTGEVLHPNISWVDGRAEKEAARLMRKFLGRRVFRSIVGIEITGKDVIPKLMWIRDNLPDIYDRTDKFLDVNGYMKFMCTGRMVAEWSGACSYAFNLKKKDWERIFFKLAGLDLEKLPELIRSVDEAGPLTGNAAAAMGLPAGIPVYGGCDDTQSAVIGSGAIGEGETHVYLGTAAQVSVSTKRNIRFRRGAVCLQNADPEMNLVVGVTEAAGVNIEWILDSFYQEEKTAGGHAAAFARFEEEIAAVPAGSDHLVFTPWFLGERCPVSTTTTRSTLFNLSHNHGRGHLARAHCEGIGYNVRWILDNMAKDFGFDAKELRIIGGGSSNDTWMQIMADITGRRVHRTNHPRHAGAIGGAMCAMVGSGTFDHFDRIHSIVRITRTFEPDAAHASVYDDLFATYQALYKSLRKTYIDANLKRFNA
jgi:xylulokinase